MNPLPVPLPTFPPQLLARTYPIYPILGLTCTFLATWIAIVLIPQDPSPEGALFASALVMTMGLAIAPLLASLRNPQTILRAEHMLILAPIYWVLLDLLQGVYRVTVEREAVEGAFIAIGLFAAGLWIAALQRPWSLPGSIRRSASYVLAPKGLFRLILVFFALGIVRFAAPAGFNPFTMVYYLGQNRWAAPWSRGALGGWDAFLDHMAYFGYLLPTLTVLLGLRTRRVDGRLLISVALTILMALFLGHGGNRRIIGVVFGAALICWVLEQAKQLTLKRLGIVVGCMALLLFTMQYMLEYRNVGFRTLVDGGKELQYEHLHVDDNFLRLGQMIELIPDTHPYVYEKQIVFTLIRPIPRVFWPGKPTDPGFNLSEAVGLQGTSLSSSVIGEWYLSFGWLGVFWGGWLYGRLAGMTSGLLLHYRGSSAALVYSLMAMALFAGIRSMLDLVLMSYALIAWMLVSWLMFPRRKTA